MNLILAIGKKAGRMNTLALVMQLVYEKETPEFKPAILWIKIDLMSRHPCGGVG